ncbi:nuclear pore complex protein [Canna indica]|uniref:Nuclear pore complex protein n=1 Tax=Canna indica TaxID=4628 RepID=A0AAQ3L3Z9_9LILI|nr:nuclear pore complex protein [Canna indica]
MARCWPASIMAVLMVLSARPVAPTSPGPHIADLNVLLPPRMTHPVEYRLQGSDGCFSWSWDHHDVLRVQPEYNISSRCSTSARLISISRYNGRKETAVYATDLHTGVTIRCKVIIDMISRIQIFHHAVKIDLDELATLHIRAFDSEENVFSSLAGLQFLWKLVPQSSDADSINHLVHVPLKETPLSDCGGYCGDLDLQIELEDKGVGSDLYVVKGTAIGHEVVTAQMIEPPLQHVMDQIILTVAEAMSLYPPSPVFVTLGALLRYCLRVIHLKTAKVIGLPSPHHKWYAKNSSVAHVDSMMGVAHAVNLGITDVVVEDTRVSGHFQTSSMHVVVPDKLCLYLVPVTNSSVPLEGMTPISSSDVWYVFPGQEYMINIKVFSKGPDANEILVTEENDLRLESNTSRYWDLYSVSKDATSMYNWQYPIFLKPISQGKGALKAFLSYLCENSEMVEVLSVVQEVNVCSKVRLIFGEHDYNFEAIHLPWAPGIEQEHELKATGGCGRNPEDYGWFSSDKTIVSASGFGSIQAKKPGQAIIKVVSLFDSANYDEVVIEVSVPSSIVMLPFFPVEVVIGTQLQAAVTLRPISGHYFSRCDAFSSFVRWKVSSEGGPFKIMNTTDLWASDILPNMDNSKPQYGYPCAWTSLYAVGVGRAVLHASLSFESVSSLHSFDGITTLKAVSSIAAYYPLVAYQAGNGNQFGGYWVSLNEIEANFQDLDSKGLEELFLLPGSMMDIVLLGGPEKWDQKIEFIETVNVLSEQNLSVAQLHEPSNSGRLYRIICQTFGNFKLVFTRGNLVGDDHPKPTIATLELSVICDFPTSIVLIANEPANTFDAIYAAKNVDRSPARIRTSPITVSNGRTIRIAAVSIHVSGRAFANSSSLCLKWELSGCEDLAFWDDSSTAKQFAGAKWESFLVLQNASGLCIVRATVIGFSDKVTRHLYHEGSSMLDGQNALTDAIPLQLVSSLRVLPEVVLMVFDPEAKVNLSITGGTCSLDAYINDTQVADISLGPESTECSHFIVGARGLGVAHVIVRDSGLSPPASASALVKVASVDWIKIISPEEISLMEGTTRSFAILAGTEDGSTFDSSQYMYMKIKVHTEDGILEPVNEYYYSTTDNWLVREPKFSIRAAKLGFTTLYVTVTQKSGYEIISQVVKIEVYGPLHLHPEYIFLLPGVSYMLTVRNGPRTGVFVEFTSLHEEIAILQKSSGKLFANSIGNATVRAAVYGHGGSLICEAYGKVEVGIPEVMVLNMQSDQLCVGCNMPVFPSFREGDMFSFYEVCQDYKWTIGDKKVLSFQNSGTCEQGQYPCHSVSGDSSFMNTVVGRSAGKTEVFISMSCDVLLSGSHQQVSYNASKLLEVVSDLPLALGIPITWILPPFYTSSDLLPRFLDSYGQLDSSRSFTYSILRPCGRPDHLKHDGITIDGSKIRTKESKDLACVQAKDQATGRTEIACCVRVAEVSQVRITTTEASSHVAYLAINSKLELIISYSDYLGYPFYEAHGVVPLDIETNRPDILTIFMSSKGHNHTDGYEHAILEAKNPGNALVRISINNNPRKVAFMLVTVGAQLHPRSPVLRVGQRLNFTLIGDGIDVVHSGKWLSGNESVLTVNSITGEGYAHGEGATQVIFIGSDSKLQTTVSVMKVDQILVDAPAETMTNVPFPSKGYMFSVKFSGPLGYRLEATGNHHEVPFDCRVDPPYVGYSKAWINNVTGYSYCIFFPYSPKHLLSVLSKSNMKQLDNTVSEGLVYISVIATFRETPNVIGSAHVPYVGGFIIDAEKINLTPNANRSLVTIIGSTDVEISWNAKGLLSVTPLSIVSFGVVGIAKYEVKIFKGQPFKDTITIVLPANGQREEIDVSYDVGEGTAVSESSNITWTAVVACAIVLILTVLFFMRLLERPDRSGLSRRLAPTFAASARPGTPTTETVSAGHVEFSPQTPPPLVGYVRRTIDETPYYKREGRRRFDPQYTY